MYHEVGSTLCRFFSKLFELNMSWLYKFQASQKEMLPALFR